MSCTSKIFSADFTMESFDDDNCFFKTYVPLSNLPTPPLMSGSDGSTRSCSPALSDDETLESPLIGMCGLIRSGPPAYFKSMIDLCAAGFLERY